MNSKKELPSSVEKGSKENISDGDVIEGFSEEYKRDLEGCSDYIKGGIFDDPERRYDEVSNPLVDEERQMRQENFNKLNLPESEMLKTETTAAKFPENNNAIEPSIKVDGKAINEALKTTGKGATSTVKSIFSRLKEIREKNRQEREEKEAKAAEQNKEIVHTNEVTNIDEVLEREPTVKTIEELKDPALVSYPIIHPKTVEMIQSSTSENQEDAAEAKQIVEPEVNVSKDLPQQEKDPYIDEQHSHAPKAPTWYSKAGSFLVTQTKNMVHLFSESQTLQQVLGITAGCVLLGVAIVKRHSLKSINSIEQLMSIYKTPCQFHGVVLSTHPTSSIMTIKQIPFPRYLMQSSIEAAAYADPSTTFPLSLLALNANEQQNQMINAIMSETEQMVKKIKVFYYPSQVNASIPDTVLYGDLLIKGFGGNFFAKRQYHSLSRYLVRMGYCSVDRDINIDINRDTQKFMRKLGNDEIYAVRRKLGMWEERSSSFEDNFLVKSWFAMYRPFYRRFVLPTKQKEFKTHNSLFCELGGVPSTTLSSHGVIALSNIPLNTPSGCGIRVGSRTMRCYVSSRKGYNRIRNKTNQDRCLCYYDESTQSIIVGVFDGHGVNGHVISEEIRDYFLHNLINNVMFGEDPLGTMHYAICNAEETAFAKHKEMCELSGTTAIAAVIRSNKMYAMNIGDSRMFYCKKENGGRIVENVTTIHCPELDIEKKRIEQCGGRVCSFRGKDSCTISRVHPVGDNDFSGLAMSRSVCDAYFHRCGVISEPDLYEKEITAETVGILVGSDGLTTIFNMNECFDQILDNKNPCIGLASLVDHCYDVMYKCSDKEYVDDISGVFVEVC